MNESSRRHRPPHVAAGTALGVLALVLGSCSSGDDESGSAAAVATLADTVPATTAASATPPPTDAPSTSAPSTPAPTTLPTTAAPTVPSTTAAPSGSDSATLMNDVVTQLASDEFGGRNENTPGWELAQEYLVGQLEQFTDPIDGEYIHRAGTTFNLLGVVPGTDLADEYIVIGAHYDHLGDGDCFTEDPENTVCNGASDNAAGVAVALAAARSVAGHGGNRRSILVAFWDQEEDGLLGASSFLADPAVPLDSIVAYINFDIQGANLLPSLRNSTVMVGAETGGPPLIDAALRATEASSLNTAALSLVFGQGRSDHAPFVEAGIPSVFFTDATNGCYHTTYDEVGVVDFAKLDQQLLTAIALLTDLVVTNDVPRITKGLPLATFDDAVGLLSIVEPALVDIIPILPADAQPAAIANADALGTIVEEGSDAFDDADIGTVLAGAAALVEALANSPCDGYLE